MQQQLSDPFTVTHGHGCAAQVAHTAEQFASVAFVDDAFDDEQPSLSQRATASDDASIPAWRELHTNTAFNVTGLAHFDGVHSPYEQVKPSVVGPCSLRLVSWPSEIQIHFDFLIVGFFLRAVWARSWDLRSVS